MAVKRTQVGDNNLYFSTSQNTLPKSMATQIETDEYKYNEDYVNGLVEKGDYNTCNRYLECFHFKNPEDEYAFNEYKMKLKSDAAKATEYNNNISKVQDKRTRDNISFMNNFSSNYKILDSADEVNDTWNEFVDLKRALGSQFDDKGKMTKEATQLQIEFDVAQSKLFGFIPVDNDDSFESFQTRIGMTESQLNEAGITVGTNPQTGNKTIYFRKDNKLANEILYQLSYRPDKGFLDDVGDKSYKISGYTDDGTNIYRDNYFSPRTFAAGIITDDNIYFEPMALSRTALNGLSNLFYNADNDKKDFDANEINGGIKKVEQSIIVGSLTSDNLMNFDQYAQAVGMKNSEYKTYTQYLNSEVIKLLKSGFANEQVFSNIYKGDDEHRTIEDTNRTLHTVSTDKYQEILDMITDNNNVTYTTGYMGDTAGLYITIGTKHLSNKDVERNVDKPFDKDKDTPTYNVFIPNFCTDVLNQMMSKDPKIQAKKEQEYIKNLNYTYTFANGESMRYSKEHGGYVYYDPINKSTEIISDKDAEDYLLQDKAISVFSNELIRENIRTDGTIVNTMQNGRDIMSDYVIGMAADMLKYMYPESDYDFISQQIDIDDLFSTDKDGNKVINNIYNGQPLFNKWMNPLNTIGYIHNMVMRNVSRHYPQNLYPNKNNNNK